MPNNDKPQQVVTDQPKSSTWDEFFAYMRTVDIPDDWMKDRPINRINAADRALFSDEDVPQNRKPTDPAEGLSKS